MLDGFWEDGMRLVSMAMIVIGAAAGLAAAGLYRGTGMALTTSRRRDSKS